MTWWIELSLAIVLWLFGVVLWWTWDAIEDRLRRRLDRD